MYKLDVKYSLNDIFFHLICLTYSPFINFKKLEIIFTKKKAYNK